MNSSARVLVACHVFYPQSVGEICQYLRNLKPYNVALYVTYCEDTVEFSDLASFNEFGSVTYLPCDNRGYDLAPFFKVLSRVNLDDYDVVIKLHSKSVGKERYTYGTRFGSREWFLRLFDATVGAFHVHDALDLVLHDSRCGLVADQKLLTLVDPAHVRRMASRLLCDAGLETLPEESTFVRGTCFVARPEVLRVVQEAKIASELFDPVPYGVFSFAHALERYLGACVQQQGYELHPLKTHRLWEWFSQRLADRKYRRNGHRIREALDLRFSDDDLLCLDGMFWQSWSVERVELGRLLSRDGAGELITLADASPVFYGKYGDQWTTSKELEQHVRDYFMVCNDASIASLEELAWSQAIVVNQDWYIMCGHDVAYELCRTRGVDAVVEVVRFVTQ